MKTSTSAKSLLITGVSSGIGLGLTRAALARGDQVYGLARHAPDLGKAENFRFVACDLSKPKEIPSALRRLLSGVEAIDMVILNAGVLGPFGDLAEQSLEEMQRVMQVNVWANKVLLDVLFKGELKVRQVIGISSGAAIEGHRGWGGYAISKAALNMLLSLAACEHSATHFCALAPGLVDTAMQDQLCSHPPDPRFPSLERLRARRGTENMPTSDEVAGPLLDVMERAPELAPSGGYLDLRKAPARE